MKTNVGTADGALRAVVGLAIVALAFYFLEGDARWYGAIGIVPILTAIVGWCPLYAPFGLSTCKAPER